MMWAGSPCRDKFVTDAPREGKVGNCVMQVSQLATPDPELDPSEAVLTDSHAIPGGNLSNHSLLRRRGAHRLKGHAWLAPGGPNVAVPCSKHLLSFHRLFSAFRSFRDIHGFRVSIFNCT